MRRDPLARVGGVLTTCNSHKRSSFTNAVALNHDLPLIISVQNPAASYLDRKLPLASAVCLLKISQFLFCLKPCVVGMTQSVVSNVCVNQQEVFVHLSLLFRLYQGIGLFFYAKHKGVVTPAHSPKFVILFFLQQCRLYYYSLVKCGL